jgi:excisionase family DNA binding protein
MQTKRRPTHAIPTAAYFLPTGGLGSHEGRMDQTTPNYDGEMKRLHGPQLRTRTTLVRQLRDSDEGPPLTTGELARVLGVSLQTIRRELEAGAIPASACIRLRDQPGAWLRIPHAVAKAYLKRIGAL